jgi:SecD/SecF fusion protein
MQNPTDTTSPEIPADAVITTAPAPSDVPAATTDVVVVPSGPDPVLTEAAGKHKISPNAVFLLGLGLLALFVYYFAAESARRKRIAASFLAVAVTGVCVWLFASQGMEQGIELQGGVSMEIRIQPSAGKVVTSDTQQQAIGVINKRLNALATGEVILAPTGEDGIFLQMPGVGQEKLADITASLEKVALLEFSILHPQSSYLAQVVASGAEVVPGYEALPYKEELDKEGKPIPTRYGLVKIKPDLSGKNVASAGYYYGNDGHSISVKFTGDGAKIMGPLTQENVGQPLAIIMDKEILSSPNVREPFSDGCQITGSFTQEEATGLASALENPLENPISIEFSNYISPTMGKATIKQGIVAGFAGLGLTLLFIMIYYRIAGVLAIFGLLMNIAIIFGTMALFQFTLTLPGIAGIILTIGIAVDANVLIFERLREEMAAGKSLEHAIDTSFDKAFSAIMDANITSLITAGILYALADGTVKGFAITLIIGIFGTLFCSLIVTRVLLSWGTGLGLIKKLSFLNFVPDRDIDFLGKRKVCIAVSICLVIASLIATPLLKPLGVELKGGDSLTIQSVGGLTKENIAKSLSDLELGGTPIIQVQHPVGSDGEFFLIRSADNTADKIEAEIEKDTGVELKDTTVSSVGSAVGKSLLITSALALAVGMIAILIYVTIRYEFAFAVGAIVALIHDVIITIGITAVIGQEITLITIGALLTIAGYSINDTIIVFDRVREGLATKRGNVKEIMNYCLNKTLGRTILTSSTTLLTVIVLTVFGGPGLRNFALTMVIGLVVGTYSSVFIAAPIVLWWARRSGTNLRREVLDSEQSKIEASGTATA